MILLNTSASTIAFEWWWLIPIACMILCMLSCARSRRGGRGMGCMGPRREDEIEALRKEIRELKEQIGTSK